MKTVIVFSGPSGSGKSTLIKHILSKFGDNVGMTVSCTTRKARAGEINGVDYHFLTSDEFQKNLVDGAFIEHVECYGNRYGTLKSSVDDVLRTKKICILDVDFKGAYKVLMTNLLQYACVGILVLPPSLAALKQRLIDRNSETEESLNIRINDSFNIGSIANYHHVIVNNELENSKKAITDIFRTLTDK